MDPGPQMGTSAAVKQTFHGELPVKCLLSSVKQFRFIRSDQYMRQLTGEEHRHWQAMANALGV
jgi:hypothetical protein